MSNASHSHSGMSASDIHRPRLSGPRSCLECRRRKIRCDRRHPCAYCTKTQIRCVFPHLSTSDSNGSAASPSALATKIERLQASLNSLRSHIQGFEVDAETANPGQAAARSSSHQHARAGSADDRAESGRLLFAKGESRYVNNSFWGSLEYEIDTPASTTKRSSASNSSPGPSSVSCTASSRCDSGFVLGSSFPVADLRDLHPPPAQIFLLWQIYLENVDPLIKMIHTPSVQRQILDASHSLNMVSRPLEALMFAIYYAAIMSFESSVMCERAFGDQKPVLLSRYRFGMEQSLARADLLRSPDLVVLQAFVIYLICARRDREGPCVWTLTALAIRIAHKLGIHRDGSAFGLSAFDVEMRRRLWWQICILDVRTAEDNGTDPSIFERTFSTRLPLNINDSSLDPDMSTEPTESVGRTEMTFSLQRFDMSYAVRKLVFSDKFVKDDGHASMDKMQRLDFIKSLQNMLEEQYWKHCDINVAFGFLTTVAAKMVLAKLKLTVHHMAGGDQDPLLLRAAEDDHFISSIEILEYSQALRANTAYQRWAWLFQTYIEWDALAYLLIRLVQIQSGPAVDRAWDVVAVFFATWEEEMAKGLAKQERRWRSIEILHARALAAHPERAILVAEPWGKKRHSKEPIFPSSRGLIHGVPPSNFRHRQNHPENQLSTDTGEHAARANSIPPIPETASVHNSPNPTTVNWDFDFLAKDVHQSFNWNAEMEHGVTSWL